jgi:hypothetical protein
LSIGAVFAAVLPELVLAFARAAVLALVPIAAVLAPPRAAVLALALPASVRNTSFIAFLARQD